MWRLGLLAVAIAGCPKFYESAQESATCILKEEDSYVLHPCPANYTCPVTKFREIEEIDMMACAQNATVQPPQNCSLYQELDQECDQDRRCGWALYCADGKCQSVKKWGQRCQQLYECREGTVCNKGRCELLFALEDGEEADTRTACASGRISNGTCASASLTIGPLPRACETDLDCISSAQQVGRCLCSADASGHGYCTLHDSDPPLLAFLAAARNNKYELAEWLLHFAEYYPLVSTTTRAWSQVVWEVKHNETLGDYWAKCAAAALAVAAGLWL